MPELFPEAHRNPEYMTQRFHILMNNILNPKSRAVERGLEEGMADDTSNAMEIDGE